MSDEVVIVDYVHGGRAIMASYGEKRPPHLACPYCTNETQIYLMVSFDNAIVCTECGHAISEKKEAPEFYVFRANGGKQHICLEKSTPPTALTERKFNAGDVEYCDEFDEDDACSLCVKRYESEYGKIDGSKVAPR